MRDTYPHNPYMCMPFIEPEANAFLMVFKYANLFDKFRGRFVYGVHTLPSGVQLRVE